MIIVLTAMLRVPAFFALIAASLLVGLCAGIPLAKVLTGIKEGFGNILQSLGLIIVMGTTLGGLLEQSGSIAVMSEWIIRKMGQKRVALAMNLIGFIVGMPVFCDSGFIILSGLNQSVTRRASLSPYFSSIALATGLLSVHCLIPPHPGVSAAAVELNVDLGQLLLAGVLIAIPASFTGYMWSKIMSRRMNVEPVPERPASPAAASRPPTLFAFLPIVLPVLLMAARSLTSLEGNTRASWSSFFALAGEPVTALVIGVILALLIWRNKKMKTVSTVLAEGVEKAGQILVIIGAGGAFGAILTALHFGEHFSRALPLERMGIFFPFLITSLLKIAQGSSTVAIITAATIVEPLLGVLGLGSPSGHLLCVLSMGAGSMVLSHANDAYFWVIAKFSGLETRAMFRMYSLATLWMGLVSFLLVYMLSLWMQH
jgi:GntP family gluconate:H+ symporter